MGIIQDLVSKEPNIFKNERGKLILEATEKFGCTYKTIYKYLKGIGKEGKSKIVYSRIIKIAEIRGTKELERK